MEGIITQRPSYGTRRVTVMRRHMRELNLLHSHKKRLRKSVPRTMVVSRLNIFGGYGFHQGLHK
jgi:hypothetical protein